MASSFRIKLKVPPNNNNGAGSPKKAQQSTTSNSNAYTPSPPRSSPAIGGGGGDSSVMGMDDSSSVFSDAVGGGGGAAAADQEEEEEEEDELEDSPPPQRSSPSKTSTSASGNRVASYGQTTGKVRKLSGAAAMKAANSLKRANMSGGGAAGSSSVTGSPGVAAVTPTAGGSTSVDVSKSPSPASESRASQSLSPGLSPSNSATGSSKRRQILASLGRPIEEMSLAEIEALPAAKRRKGLKARGAAGPGRGWRKGLKMDQKPVYRQPGESPPATVAPSTPSSFGLSTKPKSALGRDAYSKTGTPTRQSSPADDADSLSALGGGDGTPAPATSARTFSASHAAVAARKARAKADDLGSSGQGATTAAAAAAASSSTDAASPPRAAPVVRAPVVNSQAEEGRLIKAIMRGGPSVLPPPRIPVGFVTTVPLDKSQRAVRKWQKRDREVLSLGGRVWGALTWITSSSSPTDGETQLTQKRDQASRPTVTETATPAGVSRAASPSAATARTTGVQEGGNSVSTSAAAALVSPSTSHKGHSTATTNVRTPLEGSPVPAMTKSTSSSSDWRGSSAAFTAANRGRI